MQQVITPAVNATENWNKKVFHLTIIKILKNVIEMKIFLERKFNQTRKFHEEWNNKQKLFSEKLFSAPASHAHVEQIL